MKATHRDIDHGYAWLIALAGFGCSVCLAVFEGTCGLVLDIWIVEFECSMTTLSLGYALNQSVFLMIGCPISTALTKRVGERAMGMVGGVLMASCLMALAFCHSVRIYLLIMFLYGIAQGCGYPANYAMIMKYFDKRLTLVTGLFNMGGKTSMCIIPVLASTLMSVYGWRGIYAVISGLALNQVVCGALLRPIQYDTVETTPAGPDDEKPEQPLIDPPTHPVDASEQDLRQVDVDAPSSLSWLDLLRTANGPESGYQSPNSSTDSVEVDDGPKRLQRTHSSAAALHAVRADDQRFLLNEENHSRRKSDTDTGDAARFLSKIGTRKKRNLHVPETIAEDRSDVGSHLGDDVFQTSVGRSGGCCWNIRNARSRLRALFKNMPLRNGKFVKYCVVMCLLRIGTIANVLCFVPCALQGGLSVQQAAFTQSAIGISAMVACPIGGLLGDMKYVKRWQIFAVTMGIQSIVLIARPYISSFASTTVVAVSIGSAFSILTTLMYPIVKDIMQGTQLSAALGTMLLFQGIGYGTGPPISGILFDTTGDYRASYAVIGGAYMIGFLLMINIHIEDISGWLKKKKQTFLV